MRSISKMVSVFALCTAAVTANQTARAEDTQNTQPAQATQGVPPAPPAQYGEAVPTPYGQQQPAPYGAPGYAQPQMQMQMQPQVEPPPYPNLITINPLPLLFGFLTLGYERALVPHVSFFVDAQVLVWDGVVRALSSGLDDESSGGRTRFAGAGIAFGPRFFIGGEAPRGFWLSPKITLAYSRAWNDFANAEGFGIGALATLGYTWLINHFVVSLGGGAGVQYVAAVGGGEASGVSVSGTSLALDLRLAIGYAF